MIKTLTTTLQLRNDTLENWTSKNPVLSQGELGAITGSHLLKIGDGSTPWQQLPYINDINTSVYLAVKPQEDEDDLAAITRTLGSTVPANNSIAIVSRTIANEIVSRATYIYKNNQWQACEGSYDASSVYFDSDFTATAPIGTITIPSSGSATIEAEGKNLKQVLSTIFAKQKNPTVTPVSASVSFSNTTSVEAGTSVTPTYTTSFSAGSYSYGPATGIAPTSYSVVCNGETKTTSTGSFSPVVIGDQTGSTNNLTATATIEYNQGAIPKDNLGNDVESLRIASGSKIVTTSNKYNCYRNYFYGTLADVPETITSAIIRNLTKGGAYNGRKVHTITPGADGAKCVIIAYPANTTRGGLTSVLLTSTMSLDITNVYAQQVNVNVEGAAGYTAIPYTVFMYAPPSLGADEVHQFTLA